MTQEVSSGAWDSAFQVNFPVILILSVYEQHMGLGLPTRVSQLATYGVGWGGPQEATKSSKWHSFYLWDWVSLVAQRLKRLPGMRETQVWSLGREDPLEKEMATHSSTLTWRIPWREEPGRLQSMGSQRVGHDWATSLSFFLSFFTFSLDWHGMKEGIVILFTRS